MSFKAQPKYQNTQINENRLGQKNKGNKQTLIINKLPNSIDTSELKENFKNCSCGKTIVVDLIKCSCNNFSELGLLEYGTKRIIDGSENTSNDSSNSSLTKLKKNEHKYTCVKKNEDIDENDRYRIQIGSKPESLGGYGDQISKWDKSTKEKKLKVLVKIKQPKETQHSLGPVTNIDFKIKGTEEDNQSSDNQSDFIDKIKNYNAPQIDLIEKRKLMEKQKKFNEGFIHEDNSSLSFHSINNQSHKSSYEQLGKNNNATSVGYFDDDYDSSNQLNTTKLTSTPGQKVPEHKSAKKKQHKDDNPVMPAAEEVVDKPPQKLTLNAQIKLKIYQNENGEIAVLQTNSETQFSRDSQCCSRINTRIGTDGISMDSLLIQGDKKSQTSISMTDQQINITDDKNRPVHKKNDKNNNNSNNNYICETKNLYVKQKKLSSINNKILVYEEKEMQMSETTSVISEQDLNDYKNSGSYFLNNRNQIKNKQCHLLNSSIKTKANSCNNNTNRKMKSPESDEASYEFRKN